MNKLILILLLQAYFVYKAPVGTSNIKYQYNINNPSKDIKTRKKNDFRRQ
jgi:hypothetical protein